VLSCSACACIQHYTEPTPAPTTASPTVQPTAAGTTSHTRYTAMTHCHACEHCYRIHKATVLDMLYLNHCQYSVRSSGSASALPAHSIHCAVCLLMILFGATGVLLARHFNLQPPQPSQQHQLQLSQQQQPQVGLLTAFLRDRLYSLSVACSVTNFVRQTVICSTRQQYL
jgi:hypothetical protein